MEGSFFEGLAVADPDQLIAMLTGGQPEILPDPVDLFPGNEESTAVKTRMLLPFTHVNDIPGYIGGQYKEWFSMSADI